VSIIKNLLKNLKLHESTVSTVLGFLVIVVVGLLVVNYFRNLDTNPPFPEAGQTAQEEGASSNYKVAAGDSLWSISEKVYGSGYNWVDIRDANNIENPNDIVEGQELIIPEVEANSSMEKLAQATDGTTVTAAPVISASPAPTATPEAQIAGDESETPKATAEGTYTVVRGDNLWEIAESVYGDGYRWTDIAEANNLANPSIIHAGNILTIPA